MSFTHRLVVIAVIPLIVALIYIAGTVRDAWDKHVVADGVVYASKEATIISDLIHELQKERGMSAGYTASKGKSFDTALPSQHQLTEQKHLVFVETMAVLREKEPEIVDEIETRYSLVPVWRKRILAQELTVPELAKQYTDLINLLIELTDLTMGDFGLSAEMKEAMAFHALIAAKEKAGLERAMGATGFGSGEFSNAVYQRYTNLGEGQAVLLEEATKNLSGDLKRRAERLYTTKEAQEVIALRSIVHESIRTGDLKSVTSSQWFAASTAWIELIKSLEDEVSASLNTNAEGQADFAMNAVYMALLIAFLSFVASIFTPLSLAMKTRKEIKGLLEAMKNIAEENADTKIPYLDQKNEIGEFARMSQIFLENLQKRLDSEAEAERQRAKRLQEAEDARIEREEAIQRESAKAVAEAQEQSRLADEAAQKQRILAEEEKWRADQAALEAERASRIMEAEVAKEQMEADAVRAEIRNSVINTLASGLKRLAQGDLDGQITQKFDEQYDSLRQDYNAAVDRLREMVGRIVNSAHIVGTCSTQQKVASTSLSDQAHNQASALEETTQAVQGFSAAIDVSAHDSQAANDATQMTKKSADHAAGVAAEAMEAISTIQKSSREISKVTSLIDEIAFQTNLLALNAGVEAARAGDAGRGFAVVASEVRSLAQKSSEAAKEIEQLVRLSNERVAEGAGSVERTRDALVDISDKIVDVTELVQKITDAGADQVGNVKEISKSLDHIGHLTNAKLTTANESMASAERLSHAAESLRKDISEFKITDEKKVSAAA